MMLVRFWRTAPNDLLLSIMRKLRGVSFDYSLNAVLRSTKHMRPVTLIDRWERYWRIIEASGTEIDRSSFNFEGKVVFELGCGPILGWGPLAMFLGAKAYYYDEPAARTEVARSEIMREQYFRVFHRELVANYGPRMEFNEFYKLCLTCCSPLSLDEADDTISVDLCISNSVLEHVPADQLSHILSTLSKLSSNSGLYLHSIDFGPHGTVPNFEDLYLKSRSENSKNSLINLLKPSEIQTALISAHNTCRVVPYKILPVQRQLMHPFWRSYSQDDICCGVAIFLGTLHQCDQAIERKGVK